MCDRERERVRDCVCVTERVCVCVCDKESVCVCVCVCVCVQGRGVYLCEDILAWSGESVLQSIIGDVMGLPYRATHSITHILGAVPTSPPTHTDTQT